MQGTNKKDCKKDEIRKYLKKHGQITSWDAITKFKYTRLASAIWDFRHKEKMLIETEMMYKNGESYAVYKLVDF